MYGTLGVLFVTCIALNAFALQLAPANSNTMPSDSFFLLQKKDMVIMKKRGMDLMEEYIVEDYPKYGGYAMATGSLPEQDLLWHPEQELEDSKVGRSRAMRATVAGSLLLQQQDQALVSNGMDTSKSARLGWSARRAVRAAIVVVGLMRNFFTDPLGSAGNLTQVLLAEYPGQVDLFMCVDTPSAAVLRSVSFGGLRPNAVWGYTTKSEPPANPQWERFRDCYRQIEDFTAATYAGSTTAETYKWIVRIRPDTVFFEPAPSTAGLDERTVYAPIRKVGGASSLFNTFGLSLNDMWAYADVPCDNDHNCVWRGSQQSIASGACLLMSDQLAYIPGALGAAYFLAVNDSRANVPPPGVSYPLVGGHEKCAWPEGQLTCGLMDNNVRVKALRIHARISKWVDSAKRNLSMPDCPKPAREDRIGSLWQKPTEDGPKTKSARTNSWSGGGGGQKDDNILALARISGALVGASNGGGGGWSGSGSSWHGGGWRSSGGSWQSNFSRTMDAVNKVPASKKAYLTGLPEEVRWKELLKHCETNGHKAKLAEVFKKGRGVITFESEEATTAAIAVLNGSDLGGKIITVEAWEDKPPKAEASDKKS
jgi:hypothetical protein